MDSTNKAENKVVDTSLLKEVFEYEFETVKMLYNDCMENPCYGDSAYYAAWYTGLKAEKANRPIKAVENYLVALNYMRFEMSTYEIKLSLGRAEIVAGNVDNGLKYLLEFILEAKADMQQDERLWGMTEEGKKELSYRILFANRLVEEFK